MLSEGGLNSEFARSLDLLIKNSVRDHVFDTALDLLALGIINLQRH